MENVLMLVAKSTFMHNVQNAKLDSKSIKKVTVMTLIVLVKLMEHVSNV